MLGNEGRKSNDGSQRFSDLNENYCESPSLHRNERPLAGKGEYWLPPEETPNSSNPFSSIPDEAPEEAGEEETGPLEKRLESRVWKTRATAYDELASSLRSDTSLLDQYSSLLVKFLSDSHPCPQEKSLEIFKVYLSLSPRVLIQNNELFVKLLIEKCVSSSKSSISKTSSSILLDYFAEHKDNFEGFIQGLVQSLNNKNVKVQAAAINMITSLMSTYGVKLIPFKPFLNLMEKLAGNSNASVRNEAINFYKETYRWARDLVLPSVAKLKKAQQDELQKAFEDLQEAPCPTRWLKCEEGQKRTVDTPKSRTVDVYDLADAKDIFTRFNEKWADSVLEMDKWTEKKQALEILNAEANYPKLVEKNPFVLVTLAKRLMNDSNVNVMLQAVKLIGLLAKGQRRFFELHAKQFFPIFLGKLKDKKTQVIQETFVGLECLLFSVSLEQVAEEIREALEDKTPTLKINVTLWLEKVYSTLPSDQLNKSVKPISNFLKKNTDDSTAEVRAETFKLLSILYKKFPEIISLAIKDLPLAKIKKIEGSSEEFTQEEEIEIKKPSKVEKETKPEKPKPEKPSTEKPQSQKLPIKKDANKGDDEIVGSVPVEEAESVLSSVIGSETIDKLKETNWKGKVEGLQELSTWVEYNEDKLPETNESIISFLKVVVKDWKESNINVIKSTLDVINLVSSKVILSKRSAYVILTPSALDKLSDSKVAESFANCIIGICESVGPKFIISSVIKNTSECNKPKVISECFSVINRVVIEFGVHRITLKELVEYIKSALGQSNPVIKKSAQSVTVTLYSFLGENLIPLLTDIKEATMKALQEDFSKTSIEAPTQFRQVKGEEPTVYDPKKALNDLIPRVNVSSSITSALIKKLNDANWKERKDALDAIEEILDKSGKRIVPSGLDELFKSLKARLEDSNKSIVRNALGIISKLAECLGNEAACFSKFVIPYVLGNLADKQSLLRQDALATIDKWAAETGAECIIMYVAVPLTQDNPEMRTELLNWLLAHKDTFAKCDVKPMVPGIINCLQDKSANIRNAAEILFGEVVELTGFEAFTPFLKDIKPAVMTSLKQIFDKYKSSGPTIELSTTQGSATSLKVPAKKGSMKTAEPEIKSARGKGPGLDIRIVDPGDKERRLDFDSRYKWSLDEIRPDYLEKLKEQIKAAVSPDLYNLMFNADFKKQGDAASYLTTMIKQSGDSIISYLDILFKWAWIELITSNNTQIYKAVFELDQLIITQLESFEYTLSDTEAGLIIPVLCEKSGQNNQTFRTMIRSIIHSCCKVYSAEKVFSIVLQGINSKNARSKVECLEECGSLIMENGIEIIQTKDLKTISKQIASADANVRAAAADTITEVYKIVGDRIWTVLTEMPDKIRGILDSKFRTVKVKNPDVGKLVESFRNVEPAKAEQVKLPEKRTESAGKESKIGRVELARASQIGEKILGLEKLQNFVQEDEEFTPKSPNTERRESRSNTLSAPSHSYRGEVSPRNREDGKAVVSIQDRRNALKEKKMQQRESQNFDAPGNDDKSLNPVNKIARQLRNPDVNTKAEALQELNENILENIDTYSNDIKVHAKSLNGAITLTLYMVNDSTDPLFSQYFFTVLQKLFQIDYFIKELDETELSNVCELFLTIITSDKSGFENIIKIVNSILLKILDLAQPTECFVSTLMLMTKYKVQSGGKISKVLVRCLLKLAKSISAQLEILNIESILVHIDRYVEADEDIPDENGLKAMKTIINELVKFLSDDIWQYYESARDRISENSQIENWIHLLLGTSPPSHPQIVVHKKKNSIDDILEKLANDETYDSGFSLLQNYMIKNTEVDFSEIISQLGPKIENRIKNDLEAAKEPKKRSDSTYNFTDMQSRLMQMKARYGVDSNSAASSTTDLGQKAPEAQVKQESSNIPQFKSRIQKFSKK